jgi:YetA-like protein
MVARILGYRVPFCKVLGLIAVVLGVTHTQTIKVIFKESAGFVRVSEPATVSLPFARGQLKSVAGLSIKDRAAVFEPINYYSDGSFRFVLAHTTMDLSAGETKIVDVDLNLPKTPPSGTLATEKGDIIEVNTGALKFSIPKTGETLIREAWVDFNSDGQYSQAERIISVGNFKYAVNLGGMDLLTPTSVKEVKLESQSGLEAVIVARVQFKNGGEMINGVSRITAYAGKSYINIRQSIHNARALGSLGETPKAIYQQKVGRFSYVLKPELTGVRSIKAGIQDGKSTEFTAIGPVSLTQFAVSNITKMNWALVHNSTAVSAAAGKVDGWLEQSDAHAAVGVSFRYFAENFPSQFTLDGSGVLSVDLIPAVTPQVWLGAGMGVHREVLLNFRNPTGGTSTQSLAMGFLRNPIIGMANPDIFAGPRHSEKWFQP